MSSAVAAAIAASASNGLALRKGTITEYEALVIFGVYVLVIGAILFLNRK